MTTTDFAWVSGQLFGAFALGFAAGLLWRAVIRAMEKLV